MSEINIVKARPHTKEENEKFSQRAYNDMYRTIAVTRLKMHPLTNHEVLQKDKKDKVIDLINTIKETMTDDEVINEFDRICHEKLEIGKIDYSRIIKTHKE